MGTRVPTEIWASDVHLDRPDEEQGQEPQTTAPQQFGCVRCDPLLPAPVTIFLVDGTSLCREHLK